MTYFENDPFVCFRPDMMFDLGRVTPSERAQNRISSKRISFSEKVKSRKKFAKRWDKSISE